MKRIYVLFIPFYFTSCDVAFEEKEVYGSYTPIDYKNNFDTLRLEPNGIYYRKVHDKNNRLVLEMNGKWAFENNHNITLNHYYLNLDKDLVKFAEVPIDTALRMTTYLETNNGVTQFCVGYYEGKNCYQKIK